MKNNTLKSLITISCVAFVVTLSFQNAISFSPPPPPYEDPLTYEQEPPFIEDIWVKIMDTPLVTGENLLVKVKYYDIFNPEPTLTVYYGSEQLTFYDDGTNGDEVADDNAYTACKQEDLYEFVDYMEELEDSAQADSVIVTFRGHVAQFDPSGDVGFPENDFWLKEWARINKKLLQIEKCESTVKKQNSLFITDVGVVDDLARTFNVMSHQGNANGVWTFGQMMANMAGTTVTPKAFMKSWVKHWMNDQTVNGQTIPKRLEVLSQLIIPWIKNARQNPCATVTINADNWESWWDGTNEIDLMTYAPFKLTAIVNRLDLRGNSAYSPIGGKNAGETRFIFSLVAPCPVSPSIQGQPPKHGDQNFIFPDYFDWEGMNVIFEYGNTKDQFTFCEQKDFALDWIALSSYTLGSPIYNEALENLTNTVTAANAAPTRPNGSAINRIRTNEKIFFQTVDDNWAASNWQFRQFEINPSTGLLTQVPLTNTPLLNSNYARNPRTGGKAYYQLHDQHIDPTNAENLIDWVYASPLIVARVHAGNHNMPTTFPTSSEPLLSGGAEIDCEWVHHWDLKWDENETVKYQINNSSPYNPKEKEIRNQISLNTCQGCHSGETKTMFTQVLPRGYTYQTVSGSAAWVPDEAKYWTIPPQNVVRDADVNRFGVQNSGSTVLPGGTVANYPTPVQVNGYRVVISAFLTGVNYTGSSGSGTYADDDPSDNAIDNQYDNILRPNYFVVNDPVNAINNNWILLPNSTQFAYNDLQRRKEDLCIFANSECGNRLGDILTRMNRIPLPLGGH